MSAKRLVASALCSLTLSLLLAAPAVAGNKRYMTINAAKVLAERSLLEMVYGLKVRASESVENMIASSFVGTTETKTLGLLKGVMYDDVVYDAEKDVAKVTASVKLTKLTNINGEVIDLKGKTYTRVAFATSTPEEAGPLKALRAAQIDAYKQLAKQLIGFTLESQTKVENYILSSDLIKSKIMATLILAEMNEFGWHPNGDAFVRMSLNLKEFKDIIGQGVSGGATVVKVEGIGAQEDDFSAAKNGQAATAKEGAAAGQPKSRTEAATDRNPASGKVVPAGKDPVAVPAPPAATAASLPENGEAKPKGLTLVVSADRLLNSHQGLSHALQLCVYQLTGPNGFNQLAGDKKGMQELMACPSFDVTVALVKRLVIQPGDRTRENYDLAEGARFVAISAGYFAPGSGKRVYLAPLPAAASGAGSVVSIDLGSEEIAKAVLR